MYLQEYYVSHPRRSYAVALDDHVESAAASESGEEGPHDVPQLSLRPQVVEEEGARRHVQQSSRRLQRRRQLPVHQRRAVAAVRVRADLANERDVLGDGANPHVARNPADGGSVLDHVLDLPRQRQRVLLGDVSKHQPLQTGRVEDAALGGIGRERLRRSPSPAAA